MNLSLCIQTDMSCKVKWCVSQLYHCWNKIPDIHDLKEEKVNWLMFPVNWLAKMQAHLGGWAGRARPLSSRCPRVGHEAGATPEKRWKTGDSTTMPTWPAPRDACYHTLGSPHHTWRVARSGVVLLPSEVLTRLFLLDITFLSSEIMLFPHRRGVLCFSKPRHPHFALFPVPELPMGATICARVTSLLMVLSTPAVFCFTVLRCLLSFLLSTLK